ncbi:MAG: cell division protein ZapE [Gammaproteobacteria bacterium]|jgi:cell division protein ZapE
MKAPTPLQRYQQDLETGEFTYDESQRDAVAHTQALYELLISNTQSKQNILDHLVSRFSRASPKRIKGLYFWGGVGRGKTWIIDTFYDCLPFEEKMRMHFNRFMRMVHGELKALADIQDPLKVVARNISERARVICFDEFHVSDITDAMLLSGLLQALFERGVVLVTTSNEHPDKLYWDGLQRERFLPAIALLNQHTTIINVDSGTDYRLRYLDKAEIYHHPLNDHAGKMLRDNFQHIAPDAGNANLTIYIEHRQIETVSCADGVVWFDFPAICDGPRGPGDYIEISRLYQTVLISNIPQMDESQNDVAKRFMILVDEFYDRNVKLIVSAATTPEHLYLGQGLARPFRRTRSRLIEMQTHEYLARQHLSG